MEQGRKSKPLFTDIESRDGELNSSINRAEGLGGTTNYWHNALIELTSSDLRKAGLNSGSLEPYYSKAWKLFLSDRELEECARVRDANRDSVENESCEVAHMVLPRNRNNMWALTQQRYPGPPVNVVYGRAEAIVPAGPLGAGHVVVATDSGKMQVDADCFLVCAGGLGTPPLLARSLGQTTGLLAGYHDHPMAYVAKVKLKPNSRLKKVSCTTTETAEVRAGLVYESDGIKTVVYLRPAIDLSLRSITGATRFILSDLRNDPFSPKKILTLLANLEAVREAILFKTKFGFKGDYYSILLLGEQTPLPSRGLTLEPGKKPRLNWQVTADERKAYADGYARFMRQFAGDIIEYNEIAVDQWDFRTAAHHSGASGQFLSDPGELNLEFFAARGLPDTFVCDGSLLRAAGIANSGLTLAAMSYRLAELLVQAA